MSDREPKGASIVVTLLCGIAIAGCQLTQNLQTEDATLVRRVLEDNCVVGKRQSGTGLYSLQVEYIRMGKVSKLGAYEPFQSVRRVEAARIFVYSVQALPEGWVVADAAYEGQRDNLYFNRQSGAFTCSTDEWRAVTLSPKTAHFETSPLIPSAIPRTVQ